MDLTHLNELAALEGTYWWHVAKRELIVQLLGRHAPPPGRLIEGGVGAGGNLAAFVKLGYHATGMDALPEAVELCHARGIGQVIQHDLEQPWPCGEHEMDVAVLLDVIEHCHDPTAVLRHARSAVRPGGCVIVSVPAIPWLFGPWDRALGHQRRYTRGQLRRQAADAGLRAEWMSCWNAFGLPPAVVVRVLEMLLRTQPSARFPRVGRWTNDMLTGCARIERAALRRVPLPCGLSLVGVFRR